MVALPALKLNVPFQGKNWKPVSFLNYAPYYLVLTFFKLFK